MALSDEVLELTERFDRNRDAYLSGQYNETQLRREFLDPLFRALGWDVDNKQGYAEAYKDVIHEDALKIGSAVKAPDYCFRIGGTRKFFVEAKKPSVNLKEDISPAFQLRRYAWSAKLPLSILTDFEEFAVYDCRVKPIKTDKASTARVLYMTYKEYAQRWDEISSVFTRDAVLKGSFDKYAEKGRHKKGTAEVDAAFLSEIESWRDTLARNIALRNEGLTQRELNFSVQRTIDRIIFLRICEDRGIEEYGRLMALLNGTNVYKRLFQIFRNADERYNSGLFHFEKEKGRHEFPDDLTPSLDIDDKLLKDMIGRLYYPESPYEFSVLPADILGQVYEQFLGKVIRLTPGHRAIEERYRINVFDWKAEFPEIFKKTPSPFEGEGRGEGGGFDAVIGNPPYVRIQALKEWAPTEVEFYKKQYTAASKGNYDIYVIFVERGLSLLNKNGRLGFILPHKFFNAQYGQPLRALLAKGSHLSHVVHFGDKQIFSGATTYTCLMFLAMGGSEECRVVKVPDLSAWRTSGQTTEGTIPASNITAAEWNFNTGAWALLFERLNSFPSKLRDIAHLFVGLQTDADDVFILEEVRRDGKRVLCHSKSTGRDHWFEDEHLKPFLKGSLNIRRYFLADVTKRLIFPYETTDGKSVIISGKEYQERYPLTWEYLQENIERLKSRNKGQMGPGWYGYVYKKNHTRFSFPKLLVPSIATGSCFAADLDGKYYFVGSGGGGGGGYGIAPQETSDMSFLYLLGLLNSTLLSAYLKAISTPFRGGYIALNRQYIEQLPIRVINFFDASDKARHDKMVALVDQILSLNKQLSASKTDHEKTVLQRQIDATDNQIDRLVYELYGLTEEEIRIVES